MRWPAIGEYYVGVFGLYIFHNVSIMLDIYIVINTCYWYQLGIEDVYIELLKEISTNSSMTVHLHKGIYKINIRRGVRDTISHKLFTSALERLKIDGEYHSHIRFADDIHLMSYNKCYMN